MIREAIKKDLLVLTVIITLVFTGQMVTQALERQADSSGSSFEKLIEFNKLAAQQKADWLNYMADAATNKVALINKEHQEWSDFHIQQLNKLNGLIDWSVEAKEAFFKEKLEAAIKLYKEHISAWEQFAKNEQDTAKKLCDKHKADFAAKFEPKKAQKQEKSITKEYAEIKETTPSEAAENAINKKDLDVTETFDFAKENGGTREEDLDDERFDYDAELE